MKLAELTKLWSYGVVDGFNAVREIGEQDGWRLEILIHKDDGSLIRDYLVSFRNDVRIFKTLDACISEVQRIKGENVVRLALDPVEDDLSYTLVG